MDESRENQSQSVLYGINAVKEAVHSRPVDRVVAREGSGGRRLQDILNECRARQIPLRFVPRRALDRLAGTAHHQDIVAVCSEKTYEELEAVAGWKSPALLVVLDGVEDPANLGAIVRTSVAAGASGVVVSERRAAGLSPAVARAATGALEHVKIARVKNLVRALVELKEQGIWIYGFETGAGKNYLELDYKLPCALVMGSEGQGLHRLVREACDQLAVIPLQGPVDSLNVSVATGIVLYEALRQRAGVREAPKGGERVTEGL
ncbi:MAG TPA: 23S rRNA (guanosine(2251)-2'-O)-methyltransferase RlmB [Terriglobia bacterium]|nr:23S rRNA (guanosine(2251)-2'-O)-methyltransferase RlmB [Terriglobia bacterium]